MLLSSFYFFFFNLEEAGETRDQGCLEFKSGISSSAGVWIMPTDFVCIVTTCLSSMEPGESIYHTLLKTFVSELGPQSQ